MNQIEKRLLDSVVNNGMIKLQAVENDFLLFAMLIFNKNKTNDLMNYFKCTRSKISKLRNGLQNYSKNDLEKLNELHKLYKNYINEFKHIFDKVM